jgi:hypothetical protein
VVRSVARIFVSRTGRAVLALLDVCLNEGIAATSVDWKRSKSNVKTKSPT